MLKRKQKLFWSIAGALIIVTVSGVGLFKWIGGSRTLEASEALTKLGFTYQQVSQQSACCYGLNSQTAGAVVTSVAEDGLLAQAGVQPGDVIVSCNGVGVGQQCPLLGLVKNCPPGQDLSLGISDGSSERTVVFPAGVLR